MVILILPYSSWSFGFVYVVCELCQQTTDAYEEFEDILEQFSWYRFPDGIKRIMPMAIYFVQEPVAIECFGSLACSRETFKKVSWFAISKKKNLN